MTENVKQISARSWQNVADFYEAILKEIGAPIEHGKNINALVDSTIYGGINSSEPSCTIKIEDLDSLSCEVIDEIVAARQAIEDAKIQRFNDEGVDVEFELVVSDL